MGQIQNAISGAVGSVAVGAIAEQKTKGLKKEIGTLTNEKAALAKDITGLTEQKGKLETEIYARDLEMEDIGAYIEESDQEKFKKDKQVEELQAQLRHSELKAKKAEISTQKNQKAMKSNKNKHRNRIQLVSVRGRR